MFNNSPPVDQSMALPVVRCKPGKPLHIAFAVKWFRGVKTHHLHRTTMVCQGGPSCPGCTENMAPRWQGYIIVSSMQSDSFALLQFTPGVARYLEQHVPQSGGLVGRTGTFSRTGTRPNSPLAFSLSAVRVDVKEWSFIQLETFVVRLLGASRSAA